MDNETISADYVIVGAGSAGCVLASRLSADPATSVLLLEAGGEDDSIWTKIPLGFGKTLFDPRYMWFDESGPEPSLGGRTMALPHGKLLGGSSAINGLVYMRGLPFDYDLWRGMGADGWGYDDVLPFFDKIERRGDAGPKGRGQGPVGIEKAPWRTPLTEAFIAASQSIGLDRVEDFNSDDYEGAGYYHMTSWKGRRASTSEAYLKPARSRRNLRVETHVMAERVIFEGKRAVGVRLSRADGRTVTAMARREVILSAGALRSPQLLQLSGVGPARLLHQFGIDVVSDLSGVGANLMDHIHVGTNYTTSSTHTLNHVLATPWGNLLAALDYFSGRRKGPLAIGAGVAGAMFRSRPDIVVPDVQLGFMPFMPDPDHVWKLGKRSGFRMGFYQIRPESRGKVQLASPDPQQPPSITCNYLTAQTDIRTVLDGAAIVRQIVDGEPLQRVNAAELTSRNGPWSDEEYLEHARQTAATSYHFCGTARMGRDELAVVDPALRVRGVQGLRVVDASVMPTITSGNTNGPTLMIAEKAAQDILRRS